MLMVISCRSMSREREREHTCENPQIFRTDLNCKAALLFLRKRERDDEEGELLQSLFYRQDYHDIQDKQRIWFLNTILSASQQSFL